MQSDTELFTFSPEEQVFLEDAVCRALDLPHAQLLEYHCQPLHGGFEVGSRIIRCRGSAEAGGDVRPWSLVLKILRPDQKNSDPQGAHYWKREVLAYQSVVLQNLPGKVRAPRCYGVQERPDGAAWIWLEDVHDTLGKWPLERFGLAARHFGQFNGAYLTGTPLPDEAWVTHNWSLTNVERSAPMVDFMLANPDHPTLMTLLPPDKRSQILTFWEMRHRLMRQMDELPQTFCHMDAFKRNLFARGDETVAIDWAFSGIAPLGTELHSMIGGALSFYEYPISGAFDLDRVCFDGYLQGLQDVGVKVSPREVRRCYAIGLMYRFVIGAALADMFPVIQDGNQEHLQDAFGENSDQAGKADPDLVNYYQAVAFEGLRLMGIGNLARFLGTLLKLSIQLKRKPQPK